MYTSPTSYNLKDKKFPQIRLGLVGKPMTGKTTSALTFPNPIVLDTDAGLTAHVGKDVQVIPFYDRDFVLSLDKGRFKAYKVGAQPNRKDAISWWLDTEGWKLTEDQTLIIDSWTTLQDAFDVEDVLHPVYTKKNEVDDYAFWEHKINYSLDIMQHFCAFKCHVVVCFHEQPYRDKLGQIIDKIDVLMQGKFVLRIPQFFTDFLRCIVDTDKETKVSKFLWQVKPDAQFNPKTRLTFPSDIMKVEQHFNVFKQYEAKV